MNVHRWDDPFSYQMCYYFVFCRRPSVIFWHRIYIVLYSNYLYNTVCVRELYNILTEYTRNIRCTFFVTCVFIRSVLYIICIFRTPHTRLHSINHTLHQSRKKNMYPLCIIIHWRFKPFGRSMEIVVHQRTIVTDYVFCNDTSYDLLNSEVYTLIRLRDFQVNMLFIVSFVRLLMQFWEK